MGAVGTVSFFVALLFVIVVHELAHFSVAKAFGIKVTEFFVGFGPRIWSTRRGETEYGVKAIPAGGYVKIAGMNPFEEVPAGDLPRTYGAKPRWQRALVIVAGPATHFVLAFLCFGVWLVVAGQPTTNSPELVGIADRLNGATSPAAAAGLRPGDRVVAVDGVEDPTTQRLIAETEEHVGRPMSITVEREGERITVEVVPVVSEVAGEEIARIGIVLGDGRRQTEGVVGAITEGGALVGEHLVNTVKSVGRVFGPEGIGRIFTLVTTDEPRAPDDPASVVGIGRVAGNIGSGQTGSFWDILYLFGLVNIFVGFLNLLPLPPFDGGHLAVLAVEALRGGKAVDMRKVVPISAAVAAFFIVFTVAVIYVDIVKPPGV